MFFFQFLLMLHLSYQIESRFLNIPFIEDDSNEPLFEQSSSTGNNIKSNTNASLCKRIFRYITQNFTFIILVLNAMSSILDLYLCYSLVSVISSPVKTWFLIIAFFLRYKCLRLGQSDFNKFIDISSLKTTRSNSNMAEIEPMKPLKKSSRK
jgi:hypothetical protein